MAREYSRVSSNFWTGKTGKAIRKLGRDAQVVALYLMTSPHANMLGLFHAPILYIAHETGMSIEDASKALQSIIEAEFCAYDFDAECVWVCEMARFQVGESLLPKDKRVQGVMNEYERLPNNTHLKPFFDKYGAAFHMQHSRGIEAPSQPLRSQKQEQEQKQEQDQAQENGGASRQIARKLPFALDGFHEFWNRYPRKGKRPKAEEAWAILAPDQDLRITMLAELEVHKQSAQWSDAQYIPLPHNWIADRQWEDEVPRGTTTIPQQDKVAQEWAARTGGGSGFSDESGLPAFDVPREPTPLKPNATDLPDDFIQHLTTEWAKKLGVTQGADEGEEEFRDAVIEAIRVESETGNEDAAQAMSMLRVAA